MEENFIEYGYMEEGVLHSRFLSEFTENWVDEDGVAHTRTITVEEQIQGLSQEWKPVDRIVDERLLSDDPDFIIIPVPYDAGDHIEYEYVKEFDVQKIKAEIQALKDELSTTDYRVMKCYEASLTGQPLPYDIESLSADRQAKRDMVNELEAKLENNLQK